MTTKITRKVLAFVMILCMAVTYVPAYSFAAGEAPAGDTQQEQPAVSAEQNETAGEAAASEEQAAEQAESTPSEEQQPSEKPKEEKAEEPAEAESEPAAEETPAEEVSFTAEKADYLSYDPLYIAKYASDKYVDIDSLDLNSFIDIVCAAKGMAAYTIDKDKSLDSDTFIAGMNYELPVYDIDAESKYYVAIPNVNKFNGSNFKAFGLTVGYNNEFAETISGWKYEKGILYIPKSAVDNPKNKHDVPEGAPIAIQLNYAIGSDTDFSKTIPVQVLNGSEPVDKKAHADNIFDLDSLTVKTGVKGRKAGDITVFLNGQLIPIYSDAWEYNSANGEISIKAMPGVVSNVNVVFKQQTIGEKARNFAAGALGLLADDVYAVSQDNMVYLQNESGQEVRLTYDMSKMFVGWRGHYSSAIRYKPHSDPSVLGALPGYTNSVSYLYGGAPGDYSSYSDDSALTPLWSIQSYAVAGDTRISSSHDAGSITWNEQVTHYYYNSNSNGTMTIYQWMMTYRNTLKKSKLAYGGEANGIGGVNNFAAHWPVNRVIEGSSKALAHPDGAPKANPDITFTTSDITASQWYAASCSELGNAAESDDDGDIYVTCLGLTDDYIVLAFVQARSGQNMTAIYKFRNNVGYVQLTKTAQSTDTNYLSEAPNNYSLAGAVYELYTNSACTARATDISGNPITLTTDANGKTGIVGVVPGNYYAKEVTASKGFRLDEQVGSTTVTNANTKANPAQISSIEEPVKAPFEFEFRKVDVSGNHGYKQLLGTEYTISYYDVDMGYGNTAPSAATIEGKEAARSWTYKAVKKTDEGGYPYAGFKTAEDDPVAGSDPLYMEGDKKVIPRGVFTIEETKAASGMARDKTVYYCRVYQAQNGEQAATLIDSALSSSGNNASLVFNLNDDEQHPVLEVQKKDADTGEAAPQGADRENVKGSLAGAKYAVYFDDPAQASPERVGTIITDENGYGKLEKRTEGDERHIGDWLPLGRYYIEEETASPGYTVDAMYYENKEGEYKDGQHIVVARAQEGNTDAFTYTVESMEKPHITHISKYDIATGEELPGATLQVIDSEGNVVEQWVSTSEPHDIIALHDETQGLKDGKYTLREITAPYGYDIAEDVDFEITSGVIENTVEMKNRPIKVGTTANDEETQTHQGTFRADEVIVDTVKVSGLYAGRTYIIKGVLMDKTTGEPVKDAEGRDVTAQSEPFEGTEDEQEVEVKFNVNSEEFTTDTVTVVFEKLYRTERFRDEEADFPGEEFEKELAKHEDIDDDDQTIHYGGIVGTTAVDKDSKSHNILAGKNVTIVDTVKYENLSTKEEYEVKGELYDKTDGKLLGITSSVKFTPETPDGTVDVEFTFDASALENHDIVVFEQLYIKNALINKHEEPDDEDQTVHVPQIRTTATDAATGEHMSNGSGTVTIKDVVEYKNLIPGKTYTMVGTLMNKDTGKAIEVGGKPVKASKEFTPAAKDGSVELTFEFDGKALRGMTTVAFEECNVGDVPVAVHADINDEAQTVHIPAIGTKASASGKGAVKDKVAYKNLIPGKTYIMRGVLMNKKTGKPLTVDGEPVTAEKEFTPAEPNGIIELTFEVGASKLKGKTLVAFETCYVRTDLGSEFEIASHKDINDKKQTVTFNTYQTGQAVPWVLGLAIAALLAAAAYLLRRKVIS